MVKFIKAVLKIASIKPLRQLVYKLVVYYKDDYRYDREEITDLFFTLAPLLGVKIIHDKMENRITINY